MTTLHAKNYSITYNDAEKSIILQKNDENETTAYNRKKRGYAKFKNQIISAIEAGDLSTFETWVHVGTTVFNLSMRTYCGLD